jgi:DNA modification methylase
MLIEGNNLEILAALLSDSVDLIYTDPPYNTGHKFRYSDKWNDHKAWASFMADRLQPMKRVLKPTGVIAISIGKEELFNLGILMDAIFGEDNRLGIINWQKTYAPKNDSKHVADSTEYVLVYAKDRHATRDISSLGIVGSLWGMIDPVLDENRLRIGDVPLITFPQSWYERHFELGCQSWRYEQSGHYQGATTLLQAIMGDGLNSTPKPLLLIEKIIQLWCPSDGVVLDVFAGSGTSGHAVLDLNVMTGSRRTFTLIEQGNITTGDTFARTLTAERLRRVITGKWASGKHNPLGGDFIFYGDGEFLQQSVQQSLKMAV